MSQTQLPRDLGPPEGRWLIDDGIVDLSCREQRALRIGHGVSQRLRRLDRRLGIDHSDRSEWIWAVPLLTFLGTLSLFLALQRTSGISPVVAAPVALVCALVMAGLSVAYMTPVADETDETDGPGSDDGRVPALPRGWWEVVAGSGQLPAERAYVDASTADPGTVA